jgi:hypothetical protein
MDSRRLPSGSARSPATCPPWGSSVSSGTGSPNTHRFGYCVLSVFLSTHLSFYNIVTLAGLAIVLCLYFYPPIFLFTTLLHSQVWLECFLICSACLSINFSIYLQLCYANQFWRDIFFCVLSVYPSTYLSFYNFVTPAGFGGNIILLHYLSFSTWLRSQVFRNT